MLEEAIASQYMQLSPQTESRFNQLQEKYQCTSDELMNLLLESFEIVNGNKVLPTKDAIATTGQKRESATYTDRWLF